jgi:hypothetical protein
MENFFQNIFFVTIFPAVGVFGLFLFVFWGEQVTRVTVFFWGILLIALAGLIAYQLLEWQALGKLLVSTTNSKYRLTPETLAEFERKLVFALWLIPFVTGSLGTNLISDALTNPTKYKKPFSLRPTLAVLLWVLRAVASVIAVLIAAPGMLARSALRFPRRWRARSRLHRINYRKKYAAPKPPWQA